MNTLEKIQQEFKQFEEKKKLLVEELRKEFPAILKPLFDKSKIISSISWTQYTPYFNDGDECTFSVNTNYLNVNGVDIYELDWYEPEHRRSSADENLNLEECLIVDEFSEILSNIPEDMYLDLFGNHVEVTITKTGSVLVEEYDHD